MSAFSYPEAVQHLVDVALNQNGSGARVAAAVLISANSGSFTVKVPDLCLLDSTNLSAAYVVISNRVSTRRDSGSQIENGYQVMDEVFKKWRSVLLPEVSA